MTRAELIERVRVLAEEALASGEPMAAIILHSLRGSLYDNTDRELADRCRAHSEARVAILTGEVSWEQEIPG